MDESGALLLDDRFWHNMPIINESGVDIDRSLIIDHLRNSPEVAALSDWALNTQPTLTTKRKGTLTERDRYLAPGGIFNQFEVALDAKEHDDVVGAIARSTESLAFSKMRMEVEDEDQEDIWNQIARDLDLDSRLREMWGEMFVYSQVVVASYWGNKNYKVRGTGKSGVKRKKPFSVRVPLGLTMMDPFKVVPVGTFLFGKEKLLYMADREESESIVKVLAGEEDDPFIKEIMVRAYKPDKREDRQLSDIGVEKRSMDTLFLLNPLRVFRHTETKPGYHPFASVRMKSIFEILDLKNNLRQSDRSHLIGATNFIILIKKGAPNEPATPREMSALAGHARNLARIPMLIGDHRLNVEIVTPPQDYVLAPEKHNLLDARITAGLYQMFLTGGFSAGTRGDDSIKLTRMVARGLEGRRHQLKRALERHVFQQIVDSNPELWAFPDLRFTPKRIALDFDAAMASLMHDMHMEGNLSRDTMLSELDFDESEEYRKRKRAKESGYDDVFQTAVPFSSPQGAPFGTQSPKPAGRNQGGTRKGGGAAPGTNQGKTKEQQSWEEADEHDD